MIRNKSKPLVFIIVGFLSMNYLIAQESVNTSGGTALGNGGSVAYSVGQVFYTTNTGSSGNIVQGVQQPYQIFLVGTKEIIPEISLKIFPNPTQDRLAIQVDGNNYENMTYQLIDIKGIVLYSEKILDMQTEIKMNDLPIATYFLSIYNQENNKIQTFKIIKN